MIRRVACAALALALLAVGFGAMVAGIYGLEVALGRVTAENAVGARIGLGLYYRVVLVKGLLPQWAACTALLALGSLAWGPRRPRAALPLAALVAFAPAAWLLPRSIGETLPPLVMRGPGEVVQTALAMTVAVALAWWVAERLTVGHPPAPEDDGVEVGHADTP